MKLDAYNMETEHYRYIRLNRVRTVCFVYYDRITTQIESLYDYKGELTVTWDKIPNNSEQEFISSIWELEGEYEVKHKVK